MEGKPPHESSHHGKVHRRDDGDAKDVTEDERLPKRAKFAEPTPQPQSTMLQLLARDVHAQHSICQTLTMDELGMLSRTCRAWRNWIAQPPKHLVTAFARYREVRQSGLVALARSTFACQYVIDVVILEGDLFRGADSEQAAIDRTILTLPSFARLEFLAITLRRAFATPDNLRRCFAALATTLHDLTLILNGDSAHQFAAQVLSVIDVLPKVDRLVLSRDYDEEVVAPPLLQALDLSPLAKLSHLSIFRLTLNDYFSCTPAQVEVLARCKALTALDCGRWSPDFTDDWRSGEQQIEEGLATLVRGQLSTMRELGLASPRLINCNLALTATTTGVFEQLLKLPGLTALCSNFDADITADQWARLPTVFTQLRQFHASPRDGHIGFITERFLPHLLQCKGVLLLGLNSLTLTSVQVSQLVTLPSLRKLVLAGMLIESLLPLASSRIVDLQLIRCVGLSGEPLHARATLPAMACLAVLRIDDLEAQRLTADAAASLNEALLRRLPLLTADTFTQNLLP